MSDYKISVTPETFPNGMIKLTFTSNGGKFGTDELLDVIKMTPEQLLNILQANEAYTSHDKALDIDIVSGCSLEEMQSLRKVYEERVEMCARNDNYREAHEENIRLGVMDLLISKSNNR